MKFKPSLLPSKLLPQLWEPLSPLSPQLLLASLPCSGSSVPDHPSQLLPSPLPPPPPLLADIQPGNATGQCNVVMLRVVGR